MTDRWNELERYRKAQPAAKHFQIDAADLDDLIRHARAGKELEAVMVMAGRKFEELAHALPSTNKLRAQECSYMDSAIYASLCAYDLATKEQDNG